MTTPKPSQPTLSKANFIQLLTIDLAIFCWLMRPTNKPIYATDLWTYAAGICIGLCIGIAIGLRERR